MLAILFFMIHGLNMHVRCTLFSRLMYAFSILIFDDFSIALVSLVDVCRGFALPILCFAFGCGLGLGGWGYGTGTLVSRVGDCLISAFFY